MPINKDELKDAINSELHEIFENATVRKQKLDAIMQLIDSYVFEKTIPEAIKLLEDTGEYVVCKKYIINNLKSTLTNSKP